MAVTDEAMAALRAYLAARTKDGSKDAERGFLTPSRTDHRDAPASQKTSCRTLSWAFTAAGTT
jgi:hypothetical protein